MLLHTLYNGKGNLVIHVHVHTFVFVAYIELHGISWDRKLKLAKKNQSHFCCNKFINWSTRSFICEIKEGEVTVRCCT